MQQEQVRARSTISAATRWVVEFAGSAWAAVAAVLLAGLWLFGGVVGGFTDRWIGVLHAVTGVFTFIMVFFVQHAAGRESRAVLLKLDELVRATSGARDELIAAEQQPLHEQERLEQRLQAEAGA
ncbi:low affinity iron permease family protein [Catellatospora sichuanensis]|uniref:low affinity iron permease family protein n=1 Tax=Catellatospora sichuanensis TaxID=1969805 RepID=UPI001642DE42|nr:low affinity iron permease family protein [Catellatospora sichuanensis]